MQLENYVNLQQQLQSKNATLVAVSKLQPVSAIEALYKAGHRDFGENYVQELAEKKNQLPADIRWHFIGHLQSNKIKYIAPFVYLIHGVDSLKLLAEINKQAKKNNRVIDVLLQVHIAVETTKFGLNEKELEALLADPSLGDYKNVRIRGLMGMASFTDDRQLVSKEFSHLKKLFDKYTQFRQFDFSILSMGMSDDFALAVDAGSNMVRIGSLIFGNRPIRS